MSEVPCWQKTTRDGIMLYGTILSVDVQCPDTDKELSKIIEL